MLIKNTELTPALAQWLRDAHDDGEPALIVEQRGADIVVTCADGAELSASETIEIKTLMTVHAVEPLNPKR